MADITVRSDSVDVEQIMRQVRARISEKRGVDYTEEQVRELATVRLETFLDPKNLRSDLLEQFRRSRPALPDPPSDPPPIEAPYTVHPDMVFATHRGSLRFIRRLLRPILKLFFNPAPLIEALGKQAELNVDLLKRDQRRKIEFQTQLNAFDRSRAEWNVLYYEVLHNLVLETTRNGIELKNLKMRVEALASRVEFNERRVRALEGVVQYRPEAVRRGPSAERLERPRPVRHELPESPTTTNVTAANEEDSATNGSEPGGLPTPSESRRRRRRRRGRRPFGADGAAGARAQTADGASDETAENGSAGNDPDAVSDSDPQ